VQGIRASEQAMTGILSAIAKVAVAAFEAGSEAWQKHNDEIEAKRKAVNEAARKDLEFLGGPGAAADKPKEEK
jgi:hypothetical protein